MSDTLDPAEVRSLFTYDPVGGGLYWAIRPAQRTFAGARFGSITERGDYRRGGFRRGRYLEHRLVWAWHHAVWPSHHIDHIDGDGHNNRIENLRDVPQRANNQNHRRATVRSKSGLLGVSAARPGLNRGPTAAIGSGGRSIYLGTFDTAEQAHQAYVAAKRRLHEGGLL